MAESWAKYKFKKELSDDIREKKTFKDIADTIGIDRTYLSQIVNGRKCTKVIAYAFCKTISPDLEIEDLFTNIK